MGEEVPRGLHGWGCTPTGDHPAATVSFHPNEADENTPRCLPAILHKGWRRTTLYCIILFLMLLVFLNIALTLWIISALKLSLSGIGPLKIAKGGINLEGHAWILDQLTASTISSQPAQPITIRSYRNFSVLVTDPYHAEYAKLIIKRDSVVCSGRTFQVTDGRGDSVFSASRGEVRVAADSLIVDGEGGIAVNGAVLTPQLRAPPSSDLQLESLTRRLDIRAPQSINLESRAGSIEIASHSNIKLDSVVGALKIDAPNIIISNLKEANTTAKLQRGNKKAKVYQLCACSSGKLFLAAADAICEAHDVDTDLCR